MLPLRRGTASLGGTDATVIGVVLGQTGPTGPNNAAVDAGDALVRASEFSLGARIVVPAGRVVGQLTTPWGASTPVTASAAVTVLGWPGLSVPASVHLDRLVAPLTAGTTVGVLRVQQDERVTHVGLRTSSPLPGPSVWWRLTRRSLLEGSSRGAVGREHRVGMRWNAHGTGDALLLAFGSSGPTFVKSLNEPSWRDRAESFFADEKLSHPSR